jgi:hypothetical protein
MAVNPEVEVWLAEYEHPAKDAVLAVRDIILSDERIEETIKWKSPTFMYKGNLASFNPNTKAHVSLMFHTGAKIPGDFSRFEGSGDTARYIKFTDVADVESARDELLSIVDAWCESKE